MEEEEKKSSESFRGFELEKLRREKIERPNCCWTILGKDDGTIKNDRESGETRMVGAVRIYNVSNDISRIRLVEGGNVVVAVGGLDTSKIEKGRKEIGGIIIVEHILSAM